VREALGAILDAEDAPDDTEQRITRADLERAETEGLQDEASLSVFLTWYHLGGVQRGISITEAAEMPATLRNDVFYLLRELNRMRRRRKRADNTAKQRSNARVTHK